MIKLIRHPLCAALLSAFACLASVNNAHAQSNLLFLTEYDPPGQFLDENDEVQGVIVDLIRELQLRLKEEGTFELMPWGRALNLAKTSDNAVLFQTVRSLERSSWFKWVGPIKLYELSLYGLEDRIGVRPAISTLSKNYTACSYRNAITHDDFRLLGFSEGSNLVISTKAGDCLEMLLLGRVDLIAITEMSEKTFADKVSATGRSLIKVSVLSERKRYLAFSKDISDERVARWQAALEQTYCDGTMRKLFEKKYSEQIIKRLENFANCSHDPNIKRPA